VSAEVLAAGPGEHAVLFYRDSGELADQASEYLAGAVRGGGTAIVIAGQAHRLLISQQLERRGVALAMASANGRYAEIDACDALDRFLLAGWPDTARFWRVISPLVRRAAGRGQPVRVFGEMVAMLWDAGRPGAAIELEALWNELGSQYSFSLLCAYPAESVTGSQHADALTEVCRLHTAASDIPA
jgi:MEDS: MEthanogen/methylotroph, DcmR Sensory domain